MPDQQLRRGGAEYAHALAALLPRGIAWPRDPQSVLMRVIRGLAEIFGFVDGRVDDLLRRESDPRATIELLPEWERAFGLPDPCVAEPLTIEARHTALLNRMTTEGGQSRAFFIGVAAKLGYTIAIREHAPFMCGISQVGDTRAWIPPVYPAGAPHSDDTVFSDGRGYGQDFVPYGGPRWEIGPPEVRFFWTVSLSSPRLSWFRVASGQTGVDPHLRIAIATDLECVLRRWKPAHTEIAFDYSGIDAANPMAGTP
jgi:uncharacterized protein YmfQ (DUF2313 family)